MIGHLHDLYEELVGEGVVFCFSGPATQGVLEGIGDALKRKMELENAGIAVTQRIFSLYVELMHNVINYSSDRFPSETGKADAGAGVVVVGHEGKRFFVICGNRAPLERSRGIQERIGVLQAMDPQQLKDHYKKVRRGEPEIGSKGANLGLIEMARTARGALECHVKQLDADMAFLSIKATG